MDLEKEVIVLGVKRLDFDNNGDKVQGTQVWYHAESVSDLDVKGCIPNKAWLSLYDYSNFEERSYPTKAKVVFDIDMSKGKLVPKKFIFPVNK